MLGPAGLVQVLLGHPGIEDALSEKILFGEVKSGQIILIDVEGEEGKENFTFKGMARETLPDTPEDLAEAPTA